jgi:EpsI family protein
LRQASWQFVAVVGLLGATALASTLTERRKPAFLGRPLNQIDRRINGWQAGADETLEASVLSVLKPTEYLSRSYTSGNAPPLGLFISFYAQQRAGESMHSPKHCLPGSGWEIWKHDSAKVPYKGGFAEINKFSIQNGGRRFLVFYWYQSRNRIVASEYLGKFLLVRDSLFDNQTSGSIVRITVPDDAESAAQGEKFAAAIIPQVQRCFGD